MQNSFLACQGHGAWLQAVAKDRIRKAARRKEGKTCRDNVLALHKVRRGTRPTKLYIGCSVVDISQSQLRGKHSRERAVMDGKEETKQGSKQASKQARTPLVCGVLLGGALRLPPTASAPRNLHFICDTRACHEINILR